MDRITFQGKTVLITSPQRYAERLQSISDNANVMYNSRIKPGITRKCDLNDGDIFVFVHNGNDGTLRRIEYNIQLGAKRIIDTICEDLQTFGNDLKESLTCVIMGGRSNDSVTTKCVNDIADRVESNLAANGQKADLSIICGLTDELKSPIFIDFTKGVKTPEIYIPANIEGEVLPESLEEVFDMVELSNMDLIG